MQRLKLLVAVDDSAASSRALAFVAPLAAAEAVEIVLVARASDPVRAQAMLEAAAAKLGQPAQVQQRHHPGRLAEVLSSEARQTRADVVAVTPPSRMVWRHWLRRREVFQLAQQIPTSLLLIRQAHTVRPLHHVLLAGGGGPTMLETARMVGRLLAPVGGTATLCHVLLHVPLGYGPRTTDQARMEMFLTSETPEVAQLAAVRKVLRDAGVPAELKLRVGLVVDEVLAEVAAGGYDLLVIGAHRTESRLDRLLLADISAQLLRKSPVPVLLVRSPVWS